MKRERLGRTYATLVGVVGVAFLCGWSALGRTGGLVLTVALGEGIAAALFGGAGTDCLVRLPGRWGGGRSQ